MTTVNVGIPSEDKVKIAEALKILLADSYTLYLQTHNFHWNVEGPQFRELHLMFEEQYTELASAVDEVAERIRTLDAPSPATYKAFSALTHIQEIEGVPSAKEMVLVLKQNNEVIVNTCRNVLSVADHGGDESSLSLASDRMRVHEKNAWMLNALSK